MQLALRAEPQDLLPGCADLEGVVDKLRKAASVATDLAKEIDQWESLLRRILGPLSSTVAHIVTNMGGQVEGRFVGADGPAHFEQELQDNRKALSLMLEYISLSFEVCCKPAAPDMQDGDISADNKSFATALVNFARLHVQHGLPPFVLVSSPEAFEDSTIPKDSTEAFHKHASNTGANIYDVYSASFLMASHVASTPRSEACGAGHPGGARRSDWCSRPFQNTPEHIGG